MGMVFENDGQLTPRITRRSKVTADAQSWKVFSFLVKHVSAGTELPAKVKFLHQGKCGRCGRALTVPSSIESGLGPTCAGRI